MVSSADDATAQKFKGNDKLLLGMVLGVITFWLFAQTTLNVAPDMRADLGISETTSNMAVSITALFSGIFIVVFGGLADRVGRVKITQIGMILSIVGSLLIAASPTGTAVFLMSGRIIQGLSAACIMPATLALVKAYWDGAGRQRAISFWSIGSWGGSGLAALFGGFVASNLGWRWIFWFSIVVAAIALLLVHGTPESKATATQHKRFDWPGLLAFIVAMVALNVAIGQGAAIGWTSPAMLILVAVFIVFAAVFFRVEAKGDNPFVDFALFRNRTFTGATLSNFLLNGAAGTLLVALTLVQQGAGLSSLDAGLLTVGYLVAILSTIRVGEKLLQRWGHRKPMLLGCAITGLGIALTTGTNLMAGTYMVLAVIGFTLFGVGLGFYATPSTDAALSNVPDAKAGAASGLYKMASSLGAAIGVAISAAIFTALSNADFFEPMAGAFSGRHDNIDVRGAASVALWFNVGMIVVAIISIMVTIPKQEKGSTEEAVAAS